MQEAQYHTNFCASLGEMSITAVYQLVQRMKASGKPCRVFYISDFDPVGRTIPLSVARKAEYLIRRYEPALDIKLFPLVLTHQQCLEYELPRVPIELSQKSEVAMKRTRTRRDHFEAQHGEGATELDALEAIHPGALGEILTEAILHYYDETYLQEIREHDEEASDELNVLNEQAEEVYETELAGVRADYDGLRAQVSERVGQIAARARRLWQRHKREFRASWERGGGRITRAGIWPRT
jgi:hypothetical protein